MGHWHLVAPVVVMKIPNETSWASPAFGHGIILLASTRTGCLKALTLASLRS